MNLWKWLSLVLLVAVVYLAYRDYKMNKWIRVELYENWIMKYDFKLSPTDPPDGIKPPKPPPPFG